MKGVCCQCQSIHEVRRYNKKIVYDEYTDHFYTDIFNDDPGNDYVMVSHNFPNTNIYCEGSNTTPQAIIKE